MIFNERLFKKLVSTLTRNARMTILHMWYICVNAEECLPTSRSIPSHQPYGTSSLERGLHTEDSKLRLASFPMSLHSPPSGTLS